MAEKEYLFNKRRYRFLIISIFIIGIGFVLMSGGESTNPDIFNNEIYNFRRIRLAPLMVVSGFILCIFSILYKDKK
ncbi:MAG: DUF3098 domain-containing protein [Candidatus Marisimplicoccus sp.]|tara:strand:- start:734 stop:961 length:228 start_codon:yes stop_codon:yes gene_type:complete